MIGTDVAAGPRGRTLRLVYVNRVFWFLLAKSIVRTNCIGFQRNLYSRYALRFPLQSDSVGLESKLSN